jgi:hypothetical protein
MTNPIFLPANADSLARLHTAEAVGTLVDAMRNAPKAAERIKAAESILDRGHGRAVQAVISVPARQAVALKLAAMSDDELMSIAKRVGGSMSGKGSPHAPGSRAGTMLEPDARAQDSSQELTGIVDGEFTECVDDEDPCS